MNISCTLYLRSHHLIQIINQTAILPLYHLYSFTFKLTAQRDTPTFNIISRAIHNLVSTFSAQSMSLPIFPLRVVHTQQSLSFDLIIQAINLLLYP